MQTRTDNSYADYFPKIAVNALISIDNAETQGILCPVEIIIAAILKRFSSFCGISTENLRSKKKN